MTQSFDEWFNDHEKEVFKNNQGCFDGGYKLGSKMGFNAGAQSRQAEIDAAIKQRDSFIKAHHISMNDVCECKAEIDELKKRIDDAWNELDDRYSKQYIIEKIENILKGKENEN